MFILTCALLASAVLLRRMPLMALAVTLAGLVATSLGPKTEVPASALQVVVACALGLEICYMAATRTRKVSVTGVAIAGAGLPILILELPSPTSLPPERQPGGAHTLRHDRRTPGHDHCLAHRELDPAGAGPDRAGPGPGHRPDRDGGAAADRPRTARHRGAQHRRHRDPGRLGP